MEKLQMPQQLMRSINWVSDHCELHEYKGKIQPVQMMEIQGKVVCPRCELDKQSHELMEQENRKFLDHEKNKKYNIFRTSSVLVDETLLDARIENYKTEHQEEIQNKRIVQAALDHYLGGQIFNLVLQGKQGTGKSHLAYSILYTLNELKKYTCLFISVDEMLRMIRDSFNNKQSKYTESYFVQLLSSVDFLALDDLGAETGAINTDKTATDFVQRVLYGVTNARQKKSTIITTNLSSEALFQIYDKKLVSRLLKSPKVVIFKDSKDKRISKLPF